MKSPIKYFRDWLPRAGDTNLIFTGYCHLTLANGVYILYRDQKERLENSAENIGKEINISIADWIDA
jgi:hypothetical protein